MASFGTYDPDTKAFVDSLEEAVAGAGARFDQLVLRGCDPVPLMLGLQRAQKARTTEPITRASLARHLSCMKKAKQSVKWLKITDRAFLLFRTRNPLPNLPDDLAKLVDRLERISHSIGKKENYAYALARAALVRTVIDATGMPHDEEVSALVGAVTKTDCTTDAHREWRNRHKALLTELSYADELPT